MNQGTEEKREGGKALELLGRLKSQIFGGSNEQLAFALGRTTEEIEAWFGGDEEIDDDGEMKIHGLVRERLGE